MSTAALAATATHPTPQRVEFLLVRLTRAVEASADLDERAARLATEPWGLTRDALARRMERLTTGRRRAHERIVALRRALGAARLAA